MHWVRGILLFALALFGVALAGPALASWHNERDIQTYLTENKASADPGVQAYCRKLETALRDPRLKDEGVVWVEDGQGDQSKHPGPQPGSPALKRGWALNYLASPEGKTWLQADARGQQWLAGAEAREWLKTPVGKSWQELTARAPSNLQLRVLGRDRLKLAWTNTYDGQTGVEIEYCAEGQKWATLGKVSAGQSEYLAKGLAPCTTYRFRLRGLDAQNTAAIGEVASAATRPLTLHLLAIGITGYRDKSFELKFADADAQAVAAAWQAQEGRAFAKVNTRVLSNEHATREQIAAGLKWLTDNTTASDWSLLWLTGRGLVDSQGRYYFCPFDYDPANSPATAISAEQFKVALDKAKGSLVLIDSPQSAAAVKSLEKGAGRFVLATSGEKFRLDKLKQGAFARAFLECLLDPTGSDLDGDSLLSVSELESGMAAGLKRLTGGELQLLKTGTLSSPPLQVRDK